MKNGVVQDKLFLPGLLKLKMLRDSGFFGRMLAVRGEFGYWVFEGDLQPIQRPSWNYRGEDGGGIILDMLCHWRYVLDNVFGAVREPELPRRHPHHQALGRGRKALRGDRRGRRLRHLHAGGRRGRADQFVLADARLSRRPRHLPGRRHARLGGRRAAELQDPAAHGDAAPGLEPGREARRRFPRRLAGGARHASPIRTASAASGRCSSATSSPDAPWHHTLLEGAKGVQLAELAQESWQRRAAGSTCRRSRSRKNARAEAGRAMPAEHGRPAAGAGVAELRLPTARTAAWRRTGSGAPSPFPAVASGPFNRVAFAAAHVVSDPLADARSVARRRRSTGTRPSPIAAISGRSASRSPRRWTRRSAAWGSTGRTRSS